MNYCLVIFGPVTDAKRPIRAHRAWAQVGSKIYHHKQIARHLIKDTTTVPSGTSPILAPGDVRPGHMIFAPLRINRIAPLSTCIGGHRNGSEIKTIFKYMFIKFKGNALEQ